MLPIETLFAQNISLPITSLTDVRLTFNIAATMTITNDKKVGKTAESFLKDGFETYDMLYYPIYIHIVKKKSTIIAITYAYGRAWEFCLNEAELDLLKDRIHIMILRRIIYEDLSSFKARGYVIHDTTNVISKSITIKLVHTTMPTWNILIIATSKTTADVFISIE